MQRRVLLLDDNREELDNFLEAFKDLGNEIVCNHGRHSAEAMEMLKELAPDFIFIDEQLPDAGGMQVLSVIRSLYKFRKTRVYLYCERISEETSKMARLLGASGCMEKKGNKNWMEHQFKAIFAGELMPSFALLRHQI